MTCTESRVSDKRRGNHVTREKNCTDEFLDSARVALQVQVARARVLPHEWQRLDVRLCPLWQFVERHLLAFALEAETGTARRGRTHPHVRVGRVTHSGADRERFERSRENVKHDFARNDCRAKNDKIFVHERLREREERNGSHAVPPRGTSSSSPVPSSYLTTFVLPWGAILAHKVVTLGGSRSYKAASMCQR